MKHIAHNSSSGLALIIKAVVKVLFICLALIIAFAFFDSLQMFESVNRSKPLRVKADLRSLSTALESYYVDNGFYPASETSTTFNLFGSPEAIPSELDGRLPNFSIQSHDKLPITHLTTPVPYLSDYFVDPFTFRNKGFYCYWRKPNGKGFLLWSPGPDGDYDLTMDNVEREYEAAKIALGTNPSDLTYDPTNGAISNGDIYWVKK